VRAARPALPRRPVAAHGRGLRRTGRARARADDGRGRPVGVADRRGGHARRRTGASRSFGTPGKRRLSHLHVRLDR
jgi:hypothetical protein